MNSPPTIYYVLQIAVPALLLVAGWYVLYRNSVRIESRKEVREFVEQIEKIINKINTDSRQYYSIENHEAIGNLSCTIKSNFLLLSHYLFILKGLGVDFQNSEYLIAFKKNTTGGYFETTDYLQQIDIPGWQADCANFAAQLKLSVRLAYFRWCGNYKTLKLKRENNLKMFDFRGRAPTRE
jgi:hypothetical protein